MSIERVFHRVRQAKVVVEIAVPNIELHVHYHDGYALWVGTESGVILGVVFFADA